MPNQVGSILLLVLGGVVVWIMVAAIVLDYKDRWEKLKARRRLANRRADATRLLQQVHLSKDHDDFKRQFEFNRLKVVLATRRKQMARTFNDQFGARSNRVWVVGQFLFCHKTRREIYDPFIEELRADLLSAAAKCHSLGELRWVRLFIALRTIGLISYCMWISWGDGLRRLLESLINKLLR